MNKSLQIKQAMAKIDPAKIDSYLKEYPNSKTLKKTVIYLKEIQQTDNDQEIFKLGIRTAYNLDTICNPDKAGYVKNEGEKKTLLAISKELFKNTIGIKNKT